MSCTSPTFCVGVGNISPGGGDEVPFVDVWNGTTWTSTTLSQPSGADFSQLNGVSCSEPTTCMAAGYLHLTSGGGSNQPIAEYWNGTSWTLSPVQDLSSPTSEFFRVSCAGPSFCAAAGYTQLSGGEDGTLIEIWSGGTTWTTQSTPNQGTTGSNLFGISCFSPTTCTAVGAYDLTSAATFASLALTWNGQTWTVALPPNGSATPEKDSLQGVSCLNDWACMSVGWTGSSGHEIPYAVWAPIARSGYRFVASDGGVFNYGTGAPFYGSAGSQKLNAPIVGMAVLPGGDGYYLVASDGGVFNYGNAQFYGSMGGQPLNEPIVGIAVTADGGGYWLVASDGGIFSFGDAQFYGSMGGQPLNKPIVGMATPANGYGYYEVASDGGIFAFPIQGGPPFLGSTGSITLNKPIVGMAVNPAGQYYMVASDGGIFAYPTPGAPFYGSTGSIKLNQPIIGMELVNSGYYLGAADGGIFAFPPIAGPPFLGSRGGQPLNAPIVGISG